MTITRYTEQELIEKALEARNQAYTPYSHFKVGACLETKDGEVYLGCNIENAGYTATNCAERTAFFKAISEGKREFNRIYIVGGYDYRMNHFCPPCGVCLQVMMEFCNSDEFEIILGNSKGDVKKYLLKELLPQGFGPSQITE